MDNQKEGYSFCQTPLQLQLVGVGVDFVFPLEEGRKKEGRKEGITLT